MTELDRMTMNDEAAFYALHQDLKPYGKIIAEDGYLAGYEKGFFTAERKGWNMTADVIPPEHNKRYLLYIKTQGVVIGCYNIKTQGVVFGCYNGHFFTTHNSDYDKSEVIAWREIPEPPEVSE
jgi:hypothetical protein